MIDNLEQAITNYYNNTDKLEAKKEISNIICSILIDNGLKAPDIDNVLLHLLKQSTRVKFKHYLINKSDENIKCAICDTTKDLQMHHLKKTSTHPELEWDEINITFLCENCHTIVHNQMKGSSNLEANIKKKVAQVFKNRLRQKLESK
jgi:hypothetical protein